MMKLMNNYPQTPTFINNINNSETNFFTRLFSPEKRKILYIIIIFLVILIVVIILLSTKRKQPITKKLPLISPSPIVFPSFSPIPSFDVNGAKREVSETVNRVLDSIKNDKLEDAVAYFVFGERGFQNKAQIIATLARDKQAFSDNNVYVPTLTPDNIQVSGDKAQALVEYTVKDKKFKAKYNLINNNGWKVTNIQYGKELDLIETTKLKAKAEEITKNSSYSETLTKYPLPNGDVVEIEKTIFKLTSDYFRQLAESGNPDYIDFKFRINSPKEGYIVVLYEAPHIRNYDYIRKDEAFSGFDKCYSFDIRDLENGETGLILFYPESTEINPEAYGYPAGALLTIPIKSQIVK